MCHVIVGFHVLCVDLGFHVVIGVGRLTVQREDFFRQFHHAYAIPSTKLFSSGCCGPTLSCHRQLKLYTKFLHISHRENGSFEVLSLHPHDVGFTGVATDRKQALMPTLSQQPVSGVFAAKCGTKLDHGVLSFSCATESGTDYWKVMSAAGVQHEHKSGMTGDGANDALALPMLFALLASEWNCVWSWVIHTARHPTSASEPVGEVRTCGIGR